LSYEEVKFEKNFGNLERKRAQECVSGLWRWNRQRNLYIL